MVGKQKTNKEPSKTISYITNAVLCATLIGCIFAGLRFFQPEAFYSLVLTFELKSTPMDIESEQRRMARINLLPINSEQKQILINHTIFMKASPTMVRLSLGEPRYQEPETVNAEGVKILRWVYHFQDDLRPTVMQFEDDKLSAAYKVSEHRLTGYPSPEATQASALAAPAAAPAPAAPVQAAPAAPVPAAAAQP